jgi:hypothetical protein
LLALAATGGAIQSLALAARMENKKRHAGEACREEGRERVGAARIRTCS